MPRHRVTTKGNNVPEHAESFEDLHGRYELSSYLLQNLAQYGYKRPTGIQSYGIPILMEVSTASEPSGPFILTTRSDEISLPFHLLVRAKLYPTFCP